MSVRLISGLYGRRSIDTPPAKTTHSMSERARGAIFNSLGNDTIKDARVLDAFAGSGALGLEALSRGARHVTFVEKNAIAARIIRENCRRLNIPESSYDVINTTVNNWLSTSSPDEFDVIFADPPYYDEQLSTVTKIMGLLKARGYMILSHTGRSDVEINSGIVVVDNRSYANAHITFYHREG